MRKLSKWLDLISGEYRRIVMGIQVVPIYLKRMAGISLVVIFAMIFGVMTLFPLDYLHQAVQNGDLETVKRILEDEVENQSIKINPVSAAQIKLYEDSIMYYSKARVEEILEKIFGKYDIRNLNDWSYLNWAVFNDDYPMVKLLLDYEFDPNRYDSINATPLHWASQWASPEIVKELVNRGAKITIRDNQGYTPLHRSLLRDIELRDLEIFRFFIKRGADVYRRDRLGRNAFHIASLVGYPEALIYLYYTYPKFLNSLDDRDNNALHWAASSKTVSDDLLAIKSLVNMGIDIRQRNDSGHTPFHTAVYRRNLPAVKYFVELEIFDPNIKDQNGDAPLHIAARWGFDDVVNIFYNFYYRDWVNTITLERTARINPNLRNAQGYPPLNVALYNNHVFTAQALANFSDINPLEYDVKGETGLHLAARSRNLELMDNLLKRAQIINANKIFLLENSKRQRLIEVAVWNGDVDMVSFLIDRGGLVLNRKSDFNRLLANARTLVMERFLLNHKKLLKYK